MPIKVYHPDHGFVLTNDKTEIDMLVAKGGKVVVKNAEIRSVATPNTTNGLRTSGLSQVIHEKTEEPPKAEVLAPTFTRQPHHNKRK